MCIILSGAVRDSSYFLDGTVHISSRAEGMPWRPCRTLLQVMEQKDKTGAGKTIPGILTSLDVFGKAC